MAIEFQGSTASEPALNNSDIEQKIEIGLEDVRNAPMSSNITTALQYLIPAGYRPVVQLEQIGPKKRSSGTEWSWNPETARVVIYYERSDLGGGQRNAGSSSRPLSPSVQPTANPKVGHSDSHIAAPEKAPAAGLPDVTPLQIQQCCEVLAEVEKEGKLFIAFKRFRDEDLIKRSFDWVTSPEQRQQVMARAIETGAIQTQRIPNPKSPQHPTTTVKLNRTEAPQTISKRFNPIVVRGEPVSVTIMRDRGSV